MKTRYSTIYVRDEYELWFQTWQTYIFAARKLSLDDVIRRETYLRFAKDAEKQYKNRKRHTNSLKISGYNKRKLYFEKILYLVFILIILFILFKRSTHLSSTTIENTGHTNKEVHIRQNRSHETDYQDLEDDVDQQTDRINVSYESTIDATTIITTVSSIPSTIETTDVYFNTNIVNQFSKRFTTISTVLQAGKILNVAKQINDIRQMPNQRETMIEYERIVEQKIPSYVSFLWFGFVALCLLITLLFYPFYQLYRLTIVSSTKTDLIHLDEENQVVLLDPTNHYSMFHTLFQDNLVIRNSVNNCFKELTLNRSIHYILLLSNATFQVYQKQLKKLSHVSLAIICEDNEPFPPKKQSTIHYVFPESLLLEHLRHIMIRFYMNKAQCYQMKNMDAESEIYFLAAKNQSLDLANELDRRVDMRTGEEATDSNLDIEQIHLL